MGYRSLQACVTDLEQAGELKRIDTELDPKLEIAEIQRRVYQAGGPALLFTRVKGCRFPVLGNLFGTQARMRFLFRDTLESVRQLVRLKGDPALAFKRPWQTLGLLWTAWTMLPKIVRQGPILDHTCTIRDLPQIQGWPNDGGAFITLPQVYTEHPERPGWMASNLGMYRVQLSGGQYRPDEEVGMHYQIHRGIGVHHAAALRRGEPLRVSVFVGGPPALTISAVMPLPERMSELVFAGALGGRRVRLIRHGSQTLAADADFCLTGTIDPTKQLPEGPFGDHLGYYSLAHNFPVLRVEQVWHRHDAIWPFTSVGRPPQEDTMFGEFIHDLTGPVIPTVISGLHAVHAVDAAGVHPLLLAIGSERYVPYAERKRPQELLTLSNAILGQGQLSLAKYLLIIAKEDAPDLDIHDIPAFLRHLLERIDWQRDLHFQTCTTIDTLDYSGGAFNEGSKVVLAAVGPKQRDLPTELPSELSLPEAFANPRICLPGILAIRAPAYAPGEDGRDRALSRFCQHFERGAPLNRFPLILLVDDSDFAAKTLNNWIWVACTRSNPAADIDGIDAFVHDKHWGCRGALVIDARTKPWLAPPLVEDPAVTKRIESLAASGGPLHGLLG